MSDTHSTFDTRLIHAGEPEPRILGAITTPIFQSSTFEYRRGGAARDIRYIRLNNTPNHIALHRKLAALAGAEDALVTSSGMAAISTALLSLLSSGDHLLVQDCLYGGTLDLITKDFPSWGLEYDFIDGDAPQEWTAQLKPATRAIYVESITNPLMQVPDLEAVAAFAREHGLVSIVDNTFATPFNFRPCEWGFDLSLHSCTKYLNGHSDIVGGAIIGSAGLIETSLGKLNHLGGSMDPHTCFLLQRGMKTLALRMRQQNASTMEIARFLEDHPAIRTVNYPGLESHARHARAARLFEGCGGMISFELKGGPPAVDRFLDRVTLAAVAPSLGGVESLVTLPAATSHAALSPEERRRAGISETLIRLSVGIEGTRDLIEDLANALS